MKLALLTCVNPSDPDVDEASTLAAFRAAGHEAEPVVWDDPAADFGAYDALLLRATWDYAEKSDTFAAWLDRPEVRDRLWNPADLVKWNLHKGYLLELEANGIPIVPTALIPKGSPASALGETLEARGWDDIVLKPAISAGSARTRRFEPGQSEQAKAFLASWLAEADAMVQPYLKSVESNPSESGTRGERAIVWIDGEVTHIVEKSRRFEGDEEDVAGRTEVTAEERAFADRVIEACGHRPLYARVDVMDDDQGNTLLSELEVIEPSLYVDLGPGSVDVFVRAVERRCASGVTG